MLAAQLDAALLDASAAKSLVASERARYEVLEKARAAAVEVRRRLAACQAVACAVLHPQRCGV